MAASRPLPKLAPAKEVEVDRVACARLASLLKTQSIPADREDVLRPDLARRESGNFYLLLVAICHQTSPRGRPPLEGTVGGRLLRGWDYLSAKLAAAVRDDARLLKPTTWVQSTPRDVAELFADPELGERLTDPPGRARLIRNLGSVMHGHGWQSLEDLYRACNGRIASGYPNLLALLANFDAYQDPVQKKALLLLAIMFALVCGTFLFFFWQSCATPGSGLTRMARTSVHRLTTMRFGDTFGLGLSKSMIRIFEGSFSQARQSLRPRTWPFAVRFATR